MCIDFILFYFILFYFILFYFIYLFFNADMVLFKKLLLLSIYLFMVVLGLHFCVRAFSSCGKWGPLFIAVRGPLTIAASLVAEHRLQTRRLSNCGSRAQSLHGMWDLPRPGLEPVTPALAGRLNHCATKEALDFILKLLTVPFMNKQMVVLQLSS